MEGKDLVHFLQKPLACDQLEFQVTKDCFLRALLNSLDVLIGESPV